MDRETAKMLLESYRKQDAGDPMFAEALLEVSKDPDLAAWFAETQQFDAVMDEKFRELSVPAEVQSRVLADVRAAVPARTPAGRWWAVPLGAAALFAVGMLAWSRLAPVPPTRGIAQQAISFTETMPALQFVCFDAEEVANWVNSHAGAERPALQLTEPARQLSMRLIGSSMVEWNGRPVTMICLQNGKRMAMLYILNAAEMGLPDGASETLEERGWAVRTVNAGGQVRVLAARGRSEDLDFPIPF